MSAVPAGLSPGTATSPSTAGWSRSRRPSRPARRPAPRRPAGVAARRGGRGTDRGWQSPPHPDADQRAPATPGSYGVNSSSLAGRRDRRLFRRALDLLRRPLLLQRLAFFLRAALLGRLVGHRVPFP